MTSTMPSLKNVCGFAILGFAALSSAMPAQPKLSTSARQVYDRSAEALERRQDAKTGLPPTITDVDILQFALTLENLESEFYRQGFAKFPASDFAALGLQQEQINDLISIGNTEQVHVETLLSAISATGAKPVAPCTYKFGFTNAAGMVATASVLENVGVSAYLGAAPLVKDVSVLAVAASIVTVESRHQTFVRTASKAIAVPAAFDTSLGVRAVFSLAAAFIESCPQNSNLAIMPFPSLTMTSPAAGGQIIADTKVQLQTQAQMSGNMFCAWTNQALTQFTPFQNGGCVVPQNLMGLTYLSLSSSAPATLKLTDDITMAGPVAVIAS